MIDKERVAVFIDGSNHYHVVKSLIKSSKKMMEFNFQKFVASLIKDRTFVRTYYYTAPLDWKKNPKTYAKQQQFFEKLESLPDFKLVLCRMQKVKIDGKTIYQVKEDDIHLAVDMVKLAYNNAYDTAVLVSSDGDFVPAILAAKEIGKRIENIGFETKFSYHLKQVCDRFRRLKREEVETFFD
ncbi:MAG: NYN domain-containing protein [archaeon]